MEKKTCTFKNLEEIHKTRKKSIKPLASLLNVAHKWQLIFLITVFFVFFM